MTIEPYTCPLDPETNTTLKLYLFTNVQNVEDIRKNVIKGLWDCAVIKPHLILDPFQVIVAANKAAVSRRSGGMVTRSVHSEVLYNLALSSSISQSLNTFGAGEGRDLLLAFIVGPEDDAPERVLPLVRGQQIPMEQLRALSDLPQIRSTYKLDQLHTSSDYDLLDNIVSRIVTKNFISF